MAEWTGAVILARIICGSVVSLLEHLLALHNFDNGSGSLSWNLHFNEYT